MYSKTQTLTTIAVFAILFMAIGWMAPVMYASHAPEDRLLEVNQFEPHNATTESGSHTVCWERDVYQEATGTIIVEMYLIGDDGGVEEIDVSTRNTYFEKEDVNSIDFPLPTARLEVGEYRYEAVITMELANGRTERQISAQSEPFFIKPYGTNISKEQQPC